METIDKRKYILEVAKRRFSHYGLSKTTMKDVADDLAFSKARLQYHFADKIDLYVAVLTELMSEIFDRIETQIRPLKDPREALGTALEEKITFFKEYHLLLNYPDVLKVHDVRNVLFPILQDIKERERKVYRGIVRSRCLNLKAGTIPVEDLILECSEGLLLQAFVNSGKNENPTSSLAKYLDESLVFQKALVEMLLKTG